MRIAVATTFYPAALPFLDDWAGGVRGLVDSGLSGDRFSIEVIAISDGVADLADRLAAVLPDIPVDPVEARPDESIALVRQRMVQAAAGCAADFVIFCDADDKLLPTAATCHAGALARARVSVADVRLWDGTPDGGGSDLMFGPTLPDRLETAHLLAGNFCGFSNTAARPEALRRIAQETWPPVLAVDWWLFSRLLDRGETIATTSEPVTLYRQHAGNIVGGELARDSDSIRRRLKIVADHFAEQKTPRAGALAARCRRLARDDSDLTDFPPRGATAQGPWFGEVIAWVTAK